MRWARLRNRVTRGLLGRRLRLWYHPDFRLPITSLQARTGMEPRRADFVAWSLSALGAVDDDDIFRPQRASWSDIGRVHAPDYLEGLTDPKELGRIFGVEAWDVPVDEVLRTLRLSVGASVDAARQVLAEGGHALNLMGGLHHAGRARGGGFCPINDIAIAIAVMRAEGLDGQAVVLDLDAHPPDGTADCLQHDDKSWIGSISGVDWGPLPGAVDETVLAEGSGDEVYLEALDALLSRMPPAVFAIVLAGGDVLGRDRVGALGLTEAGLMRRERRVCRHLGAVPSLWLSGGGYGKGAWRALASTGLVLATGAVRPLPEGGDPMRSHFRRVARGIRGEELEGDSWFSEADLAELTGAAPRNARRLLGFYTAEGVELGLARFGILAQVRRLGYDSFRVELDRASAGDRSRIYGHAQGREHLIVEEVLEKIELPTPGPEPTVFLFVHWLTLRHPLATFGPLRPQLPGQEVPGLGMAREAGEMLARVASRLDLAGVALRPAWYHVAYACRYDFAFLDAGVQGRFEAMMRDLGDLTLLEATQAVARGRVWLDGEPHAWEPEPMVFWRKRDPREREAWEATRDRERERARFVVQIPEIYEPPSRFLLPPP